jgi:DNA topoisomerase II
MTVEETYKKLTQLEHVLLRPDTFVGSCETSETTGWVVDCSETETMRHRDVRYVPALYKIFDEILVNANDQKVRDSSVREIRVSIDATGGRITVRNDGSGIPVERHREHGVYVPELVFGHLLTSSNYDDADKKVTGGRNGYGAKLANIFSREFTVTTCDGRRSYSQTFRDNMHVVEAPLVADVVGLKKTFTSISFVPDLAKFGLSRLDEDDTVALMRRRAYDVAGNVGPNTRVVLDDRPIPVTRFSEYVSMYTESPIISSKIGRWEVCVSTSDSGQFRQCSFVNGVCTTRGGTHVSLVADALANGLAEKLKRREKSSCKDLKPSHVKNHLWVFVNALIENPAFDSQTKEMLTTRPASFGSTWSPPEKTLKDIMNDTDLVKRVLAHASSRQNKELQKQDGKKRGRLTGVPKLDDANDAGGRHSDKCTLILTEGDSAKALAVSGLSVVGRDRYGVFPLRGKLLNVRDASHDQVAKNAEIANIKKILGLKHGVEYADASSLRYGHLMIMTDQDHDGSHIKGLLINFLHHHFASLLRIPGFLVEFITPIVKATRGNAPSRVFYTMPEYERFKEDTGDAISGWTIKYYKGLGTSTTKEAKEYFAALESHRKTFEWNGEPDGDLIDMAFSKKRTEDRKTWMNAYQAGTYLDMTGEIVRYDDFVNKELVLFSRADLQRSIPSMVDGLKTSQRKVLFACFKRRLRQDIKVAQLSGYVSEHAAYHHGEQSLASTIVGLAQDHVGSNNVNVLVPSGQFGTRLAGGKDHASARYIFTRLAATCRAMFSEADDGLLNYLDDDGQSIEPDHYLPVVPFVLVNGADGIGTGWSTSIPNFDPREVIRNVRRALDGDSLVPMRPWYRGFRGTIEPEDDSSTSRYAITGEHELTDDGTLVISELPVRTWTVDYKEFLESLMTTKNAEGVLTAKRKTTDSTSATPLVLDYKEHHTDSAVRFEIKIAPGKIEWLRRHGVAKVFRLTTRVSTTNMHCFDEKGAITKYATPLAIVEAFVPFRLAAYERRRENLVRATERELDRLANKAKFVLAVVDGTIVVGNKKKETLVHELREKGFKSDGPATAPAGGPAGEPGGGTFDYLLGMQIWSLTREKVDSLLAEKENKRVVLEDLRRTTDKALWRADLDALEKALDADDADRGKDENKNLKRKRKV